MAKTTSKTKKSGRAEVSLSEFASGREPDDLRRAESVAVIMTGKQALILFRAMCLSRASHFAFATEPTDDTYRAARDIMFEAEQLVSRLAEMETAK